MRRLTANGPLIVAWAMALSLVPAAAARAADWRYCYAGDEGARRFYMSSAFSTRDKLDALESAFRRELLGRGLVTPNFACPRADTRDGIVSMMNDAAAYNRNLGQSVVELDWPTGGALASGSR